MFRIKKIPLNCQTDEELFVTMQGGNSGVFEQLYNRYNKRILYYFYRMLGNDNILSQDFMQELFCKIIEKPFLFDPHKRFSTWIFSIAHNMCKNEYRSKEVRKIVLKNDNLDGFCENGTEYSGNEKMIEAIFEELESFDESHRTAFLLKYREGFNIEEISETLNLPEGTVKSRLFYTRKKLQEILAGKYAETIENLF
jgi:RNA polymerase sigma-70 factor, ECF subfamily